MNCKKLLAFCLFSLLIITQGCESSRNTKNLISISVTPSSPSILVSNTQQFIATGTSSDGTTGDITSSVTWTSSATSVATITAAGLATSIVEGTSTISATLNNITGSTVLTVTNETPTPTVWTRLSGVATVNTNGYSVATDSSNNAYITGTTEGNLDGQTKTGTYDAFIIKYNSNGVKQWTKLLGVTDVATYGYGLAVDSSNNVYLVGDTYGSLDGQTLQGIKDVFLIKYDSSGTKQWTRLLGVAGAETSSMSNGITIDGSNNIFIVGSTDGDLDGETKTGDYDAFVSKYNSSGVKQWTELSGVAASETVAYGIKTDSSNNIYISGDTSGDLDEEIKVGDVDAFVTKYNSSAVKQWTKLLGADGAYTHAYGLTLDASNNIYITGDTDGDLDGNMSVGITDTYVTKYNPSGVKQWTKTLGLASSTTGSNAITIDGSNNVYTTGSTDGNLDGQIKAGDLDAFVIKYNSSGVKQWTKLLGAASGGSYTGTNSYSIKFSSLNNIIYTCGETSANLDGQTKTGSSDAFVTIKFSE